MSIVYFTFHFVTMWFFVLLSYLVPDGSPDPMEAVYLSRLKNQEMLVTILTVALVLVSISAITIFLLYRKNKRSSWLILDKNEEIEAQRQSNEEIMLILEQKKHEIEQQSYELQETTTELKWQTENALRLYDEVEQQKSEITDSILYAKRIQTALLPEIPTINEILNDYFVLFRPRDIVSGDFYWVAAKEGKTLIAVVDCTGHGVPGAFMSILGLTFLNEVTRDTDPQVDLILNRMRENVIRALKQKGEDMEAKDGMDMALCMIDWENSRIEYAGANIPMVMIRDTPGNPNELIEVASDRMPIGIYMSRMEPFTKQVLPVNPGDVIYMFSDGYCDQFGGDQLKKYKKKNLKKLLLEICDFSMTEQKRILEQTLDNWKGDLPQVDDILVFGIRI